MHVDGYIDFIEVTIGCIWRKWRWLPPSFSSILGEFNRVVFGSLLWIAYITILNKLFKFYSQYKDFSIQRSLNYYRVWQRSLYHGKKSCQCYNRISWKVLFFFSFFLNKWSENKSRSYTFYIHLVHGKKYDRFKYRRQFFIVLRIFEIFNEWKIGSQ